MYKDYKHYMDEDGERVWWEYDSSDTCEVRGFDCRAEWVKVEKVGNVHKRGDYDYKAGEIWRCEKKLLWAEDVLQKIIEEANDYYCDADDLREKLKDLGEELDTYYYVFFEGANEEEEGGE